MHAACECSAGQAMLVSHTSSWPDSTRDLTGLMPDPVAKIRISLIVWGRGLVNGKALAHHMADIHIATCSRDNEVA